MRCIESYKKYLCLLFMDPIVAQSIVWLKIETKYNNLGFFFWFGHSQEGFGHSYKLNCTLQASFSTVFIISIDPCDPQSDGN